MGEHRRVGKWINTIHYYVNGKRYWWMGVEHVCCGEAESLKFYGKTWVIEIDHCWRCDDMTIIFCPWCGVKLPDEVFLKAEAAKDSEIKECFHL